MRASASPANVPGPYAPPEAVDPEEAFVAAIASCHMLWFLDFARRAGLAVTRYEDAAKAALAAREGGTRWLSEVTLAPRVTWDGGEPDAEAYAALHEAAHRACFIANSVRSRVTVRLDGARA